jgi:hypothetical protein
LEEGAAFVLVLGFEELLLLRGIEREVGGEREAEARILGVE